MPRYIGISPSQCNNLYWQRFQDYRHSVNSNVVQITALEATSAAAHLPLAFVKSGIDSSFRLVALLGLKKGVNHCVDSDYRWQAGYIPALERTHPFRVLPTDKNETSQRALCVDMDSPWVGEAFSESFFDDEGRLAPKVQEILDVLKSLENHFFNTQKGVDALSNNSLLIPWEIEIGEGDLLEGLYRIDEASFNALTDTQFTNLRKQGALAMAYMQMLSSHQLPMLKQRAENYKPTDPPDLDKFFEDDDGDLSFNF